MALAKFGYVDDIPPSMMPSMMRDFLNNALRISRGSSAALDLVRTDKIHAALGERILTESTALALIEGAIASLGLLTEQAFEVIDDLRDEGEATKC